jgi:uncharacterized protein (UPF0548 family)
MFRVSQPSRSQIEAFLRQQELSTFSYAAVGLSRDDTAPDGYVVDHNRVRLGTGPADWELAKSAIRNWKMFEIRWLQLCWPTAPIKEGENVAVVVSHYGVWSLNASRIVYVIDEAGRFGFAYGTLGDHGESGEERFTVEWNHADNSVWYDLFAFSRPNALPAKLGRPLARRLQKQFARDSMRAMVNAVRRSG